MPSFKIIDNNISTYGNWIHSVKFNSRGSIVGEHGKPVSSDYKGCRYRLISKKERDFSLVERIGRWILGVAAVVFSLGTISPVFLRGLFTKEKAKIRFGEVVYLSSHELLKNNRIDIDKFAGRFFFQEHEQNIVKNLEVLVDKKVHEYMTSTDIICNNIKYIEEKGFKQLDDRVIEHPELDGWIMKGSGRIRLKRVKNKAGTARANKYDNIMRVFMAERMSKVVQEEELDIVIPEKRLLPTQRESTPEDFHEKYYVFSKKVEILNVPETREALRGLPQERQRKVAKEVCLLIKRTGFVDAHFGNIRWNPSSQKLAIIDTESQGLLIEKNDRSPRFSGTIKKCASIGLQELKDKIGTSVPIFAEEAEKALREL